MAMISRVILMFRCYRPDIKTFERDSRSSPTWLGKTSYTIALANTNA